MGVTRAAENCFDKVMNIICSNNFSAAAWNEERGGARESSNPRSDHRLRCRGRVAGGTRRKLGVRPTLRSWAAVLGARVWPRLLGRGAGGARLAQVPGVSRWVRALGPVVHGSRASEARHVSGVLGSVPGSLAEVQEARWLEGGVLGSSRLFGKSASWPRRESG